MLWQREEIVSFVETSCCVVFCVHDDGPRRDGTAGDEATGKSVEQKTFSIAAPTGMTVYG